MSAAPTTLFMRPSLGNAVTRPSASAARSLNHARELLSVLSADPQLSDIPVLALSAGSAAAGIRARTLGASLFLPKPIDEKKLLDAIDLLCGQARRPAGAAH